MLSRLSSSSTPRFEEPVAITHYSGIEQQPSFSPKGSRIAFRSGPDGAQDDVYIRSAQDVDATPRRVTADRNREFAPVWSSDGKRLAWHRRPLDGGDGELWVADVEGLDVHGAHVVARVFNDGGFPGLAWTPDSMSLISRDKNGAVFPLVRIAVTDGTK